MQKMNSSKKQTRSWLMLVGMLLVVGLLASCSTPAAPPPTPEKIIETVVVTVVVEPTPVPTEVPTEEPVVLKPGVDMESPEYQVVAAAWEASPHGQTYDLGKGPNTYCSRCHSPQNWDPASTPDKAPNCVTCKFASDPELRIATTMDFVPEEDWMGIGCETCHAVEDGRVLAEVSWLNVITMEHEAVGIPNELCSKCHVDSQGVKATGGRGVTHAVTLGGSAHLNWAGALPQDHRPSYCSDCHDPHSLVPKQCIDCHEEVLTLETHMKGTQEAHAALDCLACHDASGMDVAPFPPDAEDARWTTVVTETSRSGEVTTSYMKSHSVMWEVDCSRCHFEGNAFELDVLNADGTVPEPSAN